MAMVQFQIVGAVDIWGAAEVAFRQHRAAAAPQEDGLSGIDISA